MTDLLRILFLAFVLRSLGIFQALRGTSGPRPLRRRNHLGPGKGRQHKVSI